MNNEKKLNMAMTVLKIALVVIGVIATALVVMGPNGNATEIEQEEFLNSGGLGLAINYTLDIVIGGIAIILVFFIVGLITNTKKTLLSIIGIIAALVLYLIFLASGTGDSIETLPLTPDVAQNTTQDIVNSTSAGIWTTIVMISLAVFAVVLGPLMGRFRK